MRFQYRLLIHNAPARPVSLRSAGDRNSSMKSGDRERQAMRLGCRFASAGRLAEHVSDRSGLSNESMGI